MGVIIKPHGIKGVVKVHLYNKESSALEGCEQITLCSDHQQRVVQVNHLGASGADQLLQIEGVQDRAAAEALRGVRLQLDRAQLEPLEEGQHYYIDLIECQVFDEQNTLLGQVRQVLLIGESEVMEVHSDEGERLIPMSEPWLISVDIRRQRIVVADAEQWELQKG